MAIGINLNDNTDYYNLEDKDYIKINSHEVDLILFALVRVNHTTKEHDKLEDKPRAWKKSKSLNNNDTTNNR